MAKYTQRLSLKKPEQGDFYDVDDFNRNMDILDKARIIDDGTYSTVGDCTNISVIVGNGQLTIKWEDPDDIVVNQLLIAEWEMTKLVRKVGSSPVNENDGTLVVTNAVHNQYQTGYTDTGLTNGTTYYYKLFPVTTMGAVNRNTANEVKGVPQPFKTFGAAIDLTNPDPSASVVYTDDAEGMAGGSGEWDTQAIFKDIRPCVLKNGIVQYYLDPLDFTIAIDGTAADITSGDDGDVMIEFPRIGFQITTTGDTLTVRITDDPAKAGFKYYAHSRAVEGDRNKLYIGAYKGCFKDGKLRSLSDATPTPFANIGTFRTMAQANGAGYDQFAFYPMTLIQCLYLIRFKNLDCQTALGRGWVDLDPSSGNHSTGGTNTKGMFFGETTGKFQMKCFGIEDLWGNFSEWIDGLYSDANRNIMTAFQDFNDAGSGYANRGQGSASNIGGFMTKPQGTSELGFIVKEINYAGTGHFTDRAGLYAESIPLFGGNYTSGDDAGVFAPNVSYPAPNAYAQTSGRLMYL